MYIQYGKQISTSSIEGRNIDLFLVGVNHEKRALTFYNELKKIVTIKRTIMFRYKSDFIASTENFEQHIIQDFKQVYSILDDVFKSHSKNNFTLLVDYSCMTKSWYYSIILYLSRSKLKQIGVNVIFAYTPSKYSAPLSPKPNSEISPLPGKFIIPTDKPKALIVCLGYEKNKAEGIIEHLDPKYCHIYYTKPALDPIFTKTVEENNESILLDRSNEITTYKFDDLISLERSLSILCDILKKDYSIIIAPLGPKPFSLVSMLLAAKYQYIDIWRVGSGQEINEYDRVPLNTTSFIINEVVFSNIP